MAIKNGMLPISPDRRDYDFLGTFGDVIPASLPADFSIYDGRVIPNQNDPDTRFNPPLPPLPYGCTGETGAFESGIQDGVLYDPKWIYDNTPPGGPGGRGMREMLSFLVKNGPAAGSSDPVRAGYFNVYGSGDITDFKAAKIALWINQGERRGVYVGSFFYREFVGINGIVPVPSFNTANASLHCWLVTGWKTIGGKEYLEACTWQGNFIQYFSEEIYNALLAQPYSGAFTISKYEQAPLFLGWKVWVDHLVAYIRDLFNVTQNMPQNHQNEPVTNENAQNDPTVAPESTADRIVEESHMWIGKNANNNPAVPNELACVSSLVHVIAPVMQFDPKMASTVDLYNHLKSSQFFKPTLTPSAGCIVVTPTVGSGDNVNHGHCGIFITDTDICSNDSAKHQWLQNYTWNEWVEYFKDARKLPHTYLFKPI